MAESLVGKKVKFNGITNLDTYEYEGKELKIIFEHKIKDGSHGACICVGLESDGELVLSGFGDLLLFLWSDEQGNILHEFEEII